MQKNTGQGLAESVVDSYSDELVQSVELPDYLRKCYWWAYLHPKGLRFFEQQWVINGILWGNYALLRDATLEEMGEQITGRTLQVACVYGNLTPKLAQRHRSGARLDIVDAAPIQLDNLSRKLNGDTIFLDCQDATRLRFEDSSFDQILMFFLLHELPLEARKKAISEVLRVLKPGGKLVFMDYHQPIWQHPLRYLMPLVFKTLEPFALDMWSNEITDWITTSSPLCSVQKSTYFGGLYQKVVVHR